MRCPSRHLMRGAARAEADAVVCDTCCTVIAGHYFRCDGCSGSSPWAVCKPCATDGVAPVRCPDGHVLHACRPLAPAARKARGVSSSQGQQHVSGVCSVCCGSITGPCFRCTACHAAGWLVCRACAVGDALSDLGDAHEADDAPAPPPSGARRGAAGKPTAEGAAAGPRRAARRRRADDEELCVRCLAAARNNVLLPCRHLCACSPCAQTLKQCPLCRATVEDRLEVIGQFSSSKWQ
jgi:hypothetical protein